MKKRKQKSKAVAGPKVPRLSADEWREFRAAERRYWSPLGVPIKTSISLEDARELDKTALKVNLQPLTAQAVRVRNMLGLPKEKWTAARMRSIRELGIYEHMRICARVLLITDFSCIDQIEKAIEVGSKMLRDEALSKEDRIAAGTMISKCAQALRDLGKDAMTLADRSEQTTEPGAKKKNLPPQVIVPVQVNVAGGTSPPPAISVGQAIPTNGANSGNV